MKPFRVHLDPGHGGPDGGAEANGLVERDLTNGLAHALHDELEAREYTVSVGPQKDEHGHKFPNGQRVALANSNDAVLLCLHFNAGRGRYGLVEFSASNPQSACLAQKLCVRLGALFGALVSDVRVNRLAAGERGSVLLEGAHHSAVLLEPLFLDRASHAAWLKVRDNRVALAKAIADACDDLAGSV